MPLQATSGAASQDAFGGNGVAVVPAYIEEVFSCFLYTGTGASLTITNNIDLSTKGGLVWIKIRSTTGAHRLFDTARGATKYLASNGTAGSATDATSLTAFNSTGFSLGNNDAGDDTVNGSGRTYASWTFREQPKFFDVVTYTGTGSAQNISHALGSVPGCIIVKRTNTAGFDWIVYHRSTGNTNRLLLNDTAGAASGTSFWNDTTPTSTVFTVGSNVNVNQSGGSYVAYIFAHDAGGFGLTGTDNVISCGSYTGNGSATGPVINLGYEPQWLLIKSTGVKDWIIYDTMRGLTVSSNNDEQLFANTSDPTQFANRISPTSTGFEVVSANADSNSSGVNYIYIAIRRGPMKVPTLGTTVYAPITYTGNGAASRQITGAAFPPDLSITKSRNAFNGAVWYDKLRGRYLRLQSNDTGAEFNDTSTVSSFDMNGISIGNTGETTFEMNFSGTTYVDWMFRRAPGFMDEVCYTGTGSAMTVAHNLGVAPELMIVKDRQPGGKPWQVYSKSLTTPSNYNLRLNTTDAELNQGATVWGAISSTSFGVTTGLDLVASGFPYVAYLFATCPGVSKVGSYTGTGALQTVNCGFTGGARFVLIKRTDSTGNWWVYDSARGITSGNDPYLYLNSAAAEVTGTNYVDTDSTGFKITAAAPAELNANGGTYIFLAIA